MTKNNNVILIPARGGTSNVARQNLRLVADKPLIYYVIKNALSYTNNVYVSTDSDEIRDVSLLYGAKVIQRPKNLTRDSTKLEEIAFDVLAKINRNHTFEKCLILNPKYPLIKLSTIKKLFSILNGKIQTVYGFDQISYYQYKQISFYSNGFGKFTNDLSNCVITEKIVAFNCKKFLRTRKFSTEKFGLKLTENEPIALNSYHDFGVLEKILKRRRILVRVDGSSKIGLGHVHNILTILNHFRNDEILIVMNSQNKLGYKKFQEHLYQVNFFKNDSQLFEVIKKFQPHMIFNDILDTSVNYIKKLKKEKFFLFSVF